MGYSQKRLAELAKVQRRQLATLESGGNVTLSTLRKVLAQLPNLTGFEMDGVHVGPIHADPLSEVEYLQSIEMMYDAVEGVTRSLIAHQKASPLEIPRRMLVSGCHVNEWRTGNPACPALATTHNGQTRLSVLHSFEVVQFSLQVKQGDGLSRKARVTAVHLVLQIVGDALRRGLLGFERLQEVHGFCYVIRRQDVLLEIVRYKERLQYRDRRNTLDPVILTQEHHRG